MSIPGFRTGCTGTPGSWDLCWLLARRTEPAAARSSCRSSLIYRPRSQSGTHGLYSYTTHCVSHHLSTLVNPSGATWVQL